MTNIKYVIVSKDEKFSLGTQDRLRAMSTDNRNVMLVEKNTQPLSKVYNDVLSEIRKSNLYDFVVFMHADVQLDINSFEQHLQECQHKYDIFGLCGTSIMNVSQSPLNWWTGSNPTPRAKWGCVTHGEMNNQTSFFSKHSPTVTDHEVSCIDGLCIVFGKKAIESSIKFDEQFSFDFYDTDISFQAILKYGMKIGVIVEKSLKHYSVGKSILTKDFLQHEIDFRKKWNLEIPANSPIINLLSTSSN